MKQQEKSEATRKKIMDAAIAEFGENGYDAASLNLICQRGGIAKGMIYHHFEGKQALYLACVDTLFQAMIAALQTWADQDCEGGEGLMLRCFSARAQFFQEHPTYGLLFRSVTANPPAPLREQIATCGIPLRQLNLEILRRVIGENQLPDQISFDEIAELYLNYQNMVNNMLSHQSLGVAEQEQARRRAAHIFLYGATKRPL